MHWSAVMLKDIIRDLTDDLLMTVYYLFKIIFTHLAINKRMGYRTAATDSVHTFCKTVMEFIEMSRCL